MTGRLFPRIKRRLWRMHDAQAGAADRQFKALREDILKRDGYKCAYCHFRAASQDVNHIDDDQSHNEPVNLETVCPLCHGLFSVGQVGRAGEGRMIFLPELSRQDCNHLQRTIALVLDQGDERQREQARRVMAALWRRAGAVEAAFGTSNAALFGEALLRLDEERYRAATLNGDSVEEEIVDEENRRQRVQRDTALRGITILYHPKRFARYLSAWRKAYAALPLSTWGRIHGRECGRAAATV